MIYPAISPYKTEFLAVGDGHTLYLEQSGNPSGIPVVYLHGGPGGGSSPLFRSLFDPEIYRVILFDQRGCGQSRPWLSTENNNTQALLQDIEAIRQHLVIENWVVTGGSWGTTLGLLYAQAYPTRVNAMLLRGIFLARQQDLDWLYSSSGAARLFPEHYQTFASVVNSNDLLEDYWQLLTSDNEIEQLQAARQWTLWESRISRLHFATSAESELMEKHNCLPMSLLECHYFRNQSFIAENQIINNIAAIEHIPATIIHGRYDAVCDVSQAWQLNQAWQSSELLIVPEAGHSIAEPAIAHAFCQASKAIAEYLAEQK